MLQYRLKPVLTTFFFCLLCYAVWSKPISHDQPGMSEILKEHSENFGKVPSPAEHHGSSGLGTHMNDIPAGSPKKKSSSDSQDASHQDDPLEDPESVKRRSAPPLGRSNKKHPVEVSAAIGGSDRNNASKRKDDSHDSRAGKYQNKDDGSKDQNKGGSRNDGRSSQTGTNRTDNNLQSNHQNMNSTKRRERKSSLKKNKLAGNDTKNISSSSSQSVATNEPKQSSFSRSNVKNTTKAKNSTADDSQSKLTTKEKEKSSDDKEKQGKGSEGTPKVTNSGKRAGNADQHLGTPNKKISNSSSPSRKSNPKQSDDEHPQGSNATPVTKKKGEKPHKHENKKKDKESDDDEGKKASDPPSQQPTDDNSKDDKEKQSKGSEGTPKATNSGKRAGNDDQHLGTPNKKISNSSSPSRKSNPKQSDDEHPQGSNAIPVTKKKGEKPHKDEDKKKGKESDDDERKKASDPPSQRPTDDDSKVDKENEKSKIKNKKPDKKDEDRGSTETKTKKSTTTTTAEDTSTKAKTKTAPKSFGDDQGFPNAPKQLPKLPPPKVLDDQPVGDKNSERYYNGIESGKPPRAGNDPAIQKGFYDSRKGSSKGNRLSGRNRPAETDSVTGSSHFIIYGTVGLILLIVLYIVYQKRQKILALIVEGRRRGNSGSGERSRRGSGSNVAYRPLPTKETEEPRPESLQKYIY